MFPFLLFVNYRSVWSATHQSKSGSPSPMSVSTSFAPTAPRDGYRNPVLVHCVVLHSIAMQSCCIWMILDLWRSSIESRMSKFIFFLFILFGIVNINTMKYDRPSMMLKRCRTITPPRRSFAAIIVYPNTLQNVLELMLKEWISSSKYVNSFASHWLISATNASAGTMAGVSDLHGEGTFQSVTSAKTAWRFLT